MICFWFIFFMILEFDVGIPFLAALGLSLVLAIIFSYGVILLIEILINRKRVEKQSATKVALKICARILPKKKPQKEEKKIEETPPSAENSFEELNRKLGYFNFHVWDQEEIKESIDKISIQTISAKKHLDITRYLFGKSPDPPPSRKVYLDACKMMFIETFDEILQSFSNMENILVLGGAKWSQEFDVANINQISLDFQIQNTAKKIELLNDINKEICRLINWSDNRLEYRQRQDRVKTIAKIIDMEEEGDRLTQAISDGKGTELSRYSNDPSPSTSTFP